ncbi:class I SAM-dependent methyltransferase [Prosthecobacter sp.]|uniref:class I SAM-dependent methyltransferase n=1 Tax=Prosthecobacter sp. TaxID=1965333 RepID=UPI002AB8EC20|nr:class I SAM-dependent methyltransferase [Prosthecobacter sp.]MDZ4401099.1 class I SAM-dependent methyltransferase [Prosthecobacter sp.]
MEDSTQAAESQRLRNFWNSRYNTFSLKESGIMSMTPEYGELLYRCKRAAYLKALRLARVSRWEMVCILDAGCGQGYFAKLAASKFPKLSYTGVDISEKAVDHLRAEMPEHEWICGDVCDTAFQIRSDYDVCQSIEVMHLILDDGNHRRALQKLADSLRPGGTLIITDTLPAQRYQANNYIVFRPMSYYREVFREAGLALEHVFPMYYWIPDRGAMWHPAIRVTRRLSPLLIYALDRFLLTIRAPQIKPSHDSQMKMMVLRKLNPSQRS